MADQTIAPVLALVRDLMFSSKISAEAKAAGVPCKIVRDPAKLAEVEPGAQILLVDLNLPGAIEAASSWRQESGKPVIGFVSHVDSDTISKARVAGLDLVQARSMFATQLRQRFADAAQNIQPQF